ncbi:MAG: damage-inducible protein CinA [Gammaproteobacteria bacterium]|nr:MAG: damage-inducible protein CinA [Gammaproteobacteria bacterium]
MNALVEQIASLLVKRDWLLTTAESCTGGGVAQCLTSVRGSSQWFDRGYITYSNASKQEMLGVREELLEQYGAVSEQVVIAMARGALAHSRAQVSLAVTGIAGPDGGSDEKPAGTVWFAWALETETKASCEIFAGDRQAVRRQSEEFALRGLLELLFS